MTNKDSKEIVLIPMTVADLADRLGEPVNNLILTLLRQGIAAARNQVLPESVVARIAQECGFKTVEPKGSQGAEVEEVRAEVKGDTVERLPVVVVVGHVDHGKTTLLDFIRNTKVAAREKGGITQHLGAYKAHTDHGDIVFIDTPGHEAFSMMRTRGITVADVAILIIAADDGVMPQTVEAIERIKSAGLPIVVAINKVDKATPQQVEAVKGQLARYDLLPEDWGGQIVCVPISALKGEGVDNLLEVVILQSQLLELTAAADAYASGYVLESHFEKGRGPVATVICQHGVLSVGDYFVCGSMHGRVSSLKNSAGRSVKSVEPSHPVQVAGFSSLPKAGDMFRVGSAKDVKRGRMVVDEPKPARSSLVAQEDSLGLIIKADTASSLEALLASIQKMSDGLYRGIHVLSAGVGSITESDVSLSADTGAHIYGMHAKVEPGALVLAQRLDVSINLFDIIYKLFEDLAEAAEKGRPVKMKMEKTGEALVLKVFDIKKLGVIAGSRVLDGYCSREGSLIIYRDNQRIGEGKITSLQKERNPVKEVRKGFECAFMVDGFDSWQVDDRIECYLKVPE